MPMTWLTDLFNRVRAENICVDYICGTCGAGPFRYALMFAAMRASGDLAEYPGYAPARLVFIAEALAALPAITPADEPAVRNIIHTLWRVSDEPLFAELEGILCASAAGEVLAMMQQPNGDLADRRWADGSRLIARDAERYASITTARVSRESDARRRRPVRNSHLDPALIAAFAATDFHVFATPPFVLRCGEVSLHLAAMFEETGTKCAAYITAWNPDGQPAEPAFNFLRQHELHASVAGAGYHCYEGEGRERDGNWPPEPSLLVLGIKRLDATRMGRQFGQAAIVWIGTDALPELVLLV